MSKKDSIPKERMATLLGKKADRLSETEQLDLMKYADQLYNQGERHWMRIGRCVKQVVAATPGFSREQREEQFDQGFKHLRYQTAMKSLRVYDAYRNSPEEVAELGLDLADRLRKKTKAERKKLLKQHGSPRKVRDSLVASEPEVVAEHRIGLGDHDDFINVPLRTQPEKVVMACSGLAKEVVSELRKNKPLSGGKAYELDGDFGAVSEKPISLSVEDGRVVIELHCKKPSAVTRATIIAACVGFEYLQRLIQKGERMD